MFSDYIGAEICEILSCLHVLTGSNYTSPFFRKTKVQSFKRMVAAPSSVSLLSSMKSENVDIPVVIKFILQIIYNRPKMEKTPAETRYRILFEKKESKNKFSSTTFIPPNQSSLKMKILHCTFLSHSMVSCLNRYHLPLNPATYG